MGETIIPWRQLGDLLVERGVISDSALESALAEQETTQRPIGEILLVRGLVSVSELTVALVDQLGRELGEHASIGPALLGEAARTPGDLGAKMLQEGDSGRFSAGRRLTPRMVAETSSNEDAQLERELGDMQITGKMGEPQLAGERERHELAEWELAQARAALAGRQAIIDALAHELAQARAELAGRQAIIDALAYELAQVPAAIEGRQAIIDALTGKRLQSSGSQEQERGTKRGASAERTTPKRSRA